MLNWAIEPFAKGHDRSEFRCGHASLDAFIRERVSQYEKRGLGKTFVAVQAYEKRVIGYYTLAAGAMTLESIPAQAARKLPKHPVPAIVLARLAVDQSARGQRLGEALLLNALQKSLDLSGQLGVHAVYVDALDDAAVQFYAKYGFVSLLNDPLHLYIPIAGIEEILG